jgi:DNA polymerase-3 subunit gamma/tau
VADQALYLKWRPTAFDEVVGQEHIIRTLRNSLKTGRIRHAYLFSGPRGTGKTTTARLLAKAVNCKHENFDIRPCNECAACLAVNEGRYLDLIEIDAATHTGVDDVRELRDKIAFAPGEGRYKVYIIDEVHRFSGSAFDALLKTLEEPPDHALFVLATTEIDKVPQTIKSRCLQFEFRRMSVTEVADRLQKIAIAEQLDIERAALELIARQGTGSLRDSISLLDQIVSDPSDQITLEVAQRILGTANTRAVKEMIEAFSQQNIARALHVINEAIDAGSDPRQFGQQVVEHLRAILLTQAAGPDLIEASDDERETYGRQARLISRGTLLRAIRLFNDAVIQYRGGWQPQLPLELALIESLKTSEPEPVAYQPTANAPTQRPAAPAPLAEPDVEPTPPGEPPIVPPDQITQRWGEMLRALVRYSSNAPAVLEHYRLQKVDGNRVYLCTDTKIYFDRLYGQTEKLKTIEKAFADTFRQRIKIFVVLVESFDTMRDTHSDAPSDSALWQSIRDAGGKISETPKKS